MEKNLIEIDEGSDENYRMQEAEMRDDPKTSQNNADVMQYRSLRYIHLQTPQESALPGIARPIWDPPVADKTLANPA
ncbi:hypothetical protein ACLOJK_008470 [Asimina triloba]